jgi:hypothetical protein
VAPVRIHDSDMYYVRVPIIHWDSRDHHGCDGLLLVVRVVDHRCHWRIHKIDWPPREEPKMMIPGWSIRETAKYYFFLSARSAHFVARIQCARPH